VRFLTSAKPYSRSRVRSQDGDSIEPLARSGRAADDVHTREARPMRRFGPGYRVYYARAGKTLYMLLCGGDKSSQDADIKNAHAMWKELNPPAKKPAKAKKE
jgi:hypothetical protein